MKANELRIGNKLLLLGEVCTIECISNLPKRKDMYWIKTKEFIETKIIHFKPIPLTEEILLKCGFEKIKNRIHDTYHFQYGAFYFEIILQNDEINWHLKLSNHEWDTITPYLGLGVVKYLHSLQNIIFTITNEELTINL